MAWNTLSIADVQNKLADAEYRAVTAASLPDGTTGAAVVNEEIANAVQAVRGYIAGHAANILGDGDTVPDELRDSVLVVIRYKVFTRLPRMKQLLDELRVREYEEALRLWKDVSAGRFRVVNPEVPAPDQAGGSTIQVVRKQRPWGRRENTHGLF